MAIIRSMYVGWKIYVLVRAGSLFWVDGIRFLYGPRAVVQLCHSKICAIIYSTGQTIYNVSK
jgi:hypothetical protein